MHTQDELSKGILLMLVGTFSLEVIHMFVTRDKIYRLFLLFQTNRTQVQYDPLSEQQKYEIKQQVRRYVEGGLDEIDVSRLFNA